MSHSKQKHPNYLEMFHLAQQAHGDSKSETASVITRTGQSDESVSGQTTLEYMLDSRSTNVFKWLEWIVMGELELIFCKKKAHPKQYETATDLCQNSQEIYVLAGGGGGKEDICQGRYCYHFRSCV